MEGTNPSELKVEIKAFTENLLINMAAVRLTKVYPDWNMVAKATLLNVIDEETERLVTIECGCSGGPGEQPGSPGSSERSADCGKGSKVGPLGIAAPGRSEHFHLLDR